MEQELEKRMKSLEFMNKVNLFITSGVALAFIAYMIGLL